MIELQMLLQLEKINWHKYVCNSAISYNKNWFWTLQKVKANSSF